MHLEQDDVAGAQPEAAWLMAAAEPMPPCETALATASEDMPTMPTVFTSPLNSPSTPLPWLVQSTPARRVPATTPPWFCDEIFVREAPVAFDVDDADVAPASARLRPGPSRVDSARRRVQVDLACGEIGRRRRRLFGRGGHVVDRGEFHARLEKGALDQFARRELLAQLLETFGRRIDA